MATLPHCLLSILLSFNVLIDAFANELFLNTQYIAKLRYSNIITWLFADCTSNLLDQSLSGSQTATEDFDNVFCIDDMSLLYFHICFFPVTE